MKLDIMLYDISRMTTIYEKKYSDMSDKEQTEFLITLKNKLIKLNNDVDKRIIDKLNNK